MEAERNASETLRKYPWNHLASTLTLGSTPRRTGQAKWCSSIHKGATTCEANKTAAAKQWRPARKARANSLTDIPAIPYLYCYRTFCVQTDRSSHHNPLMTEVALVASHIGWTATTAISLSYMQWNKLDDALNILTMIWPVVTCKAQHTATHDIFTKASSLHSYLS